jgi:hypothetical protein
MSHLLTSYLDVVTLLTDKCICEVTANISDTLYTACQQVCIFCSRVVAIRTNLIIAVYSPYIISSK